MKNFYLILILLLILCFKGYSQTPIGAGIPTDSTFLQGYNYDYLPTGTGDLTGSYSFTGIIGLGSYNSLAVVQTVNTAAPGLCHLVVGTGYKGGTPKLDSLGWSQVLLYFANGQYEKIDLKTFPYVAIRAKTTYKSVSNVNMGLAFTNLNPSPSLSFTLLGDGKWHRIALDFGAQPPIWATFSGETHYTFSDTATLDFDYVYFGIDGDPDSSIHFGNFRMLDTTLAGAQIKGNGTIESPYMYQCNKNTGSALQQILPLLGCMVGDSVPAGLTIGFSNSNSTLATNCSVDALGGDSISNLKFLPALNLVGTSNVKLVLTYQRGGGLAKDSVTKFKTIYLTIQVLQNPQAIISPTSSVILENQTLAQINIQSAQNSVGTTTSLRVSGATNDSKLITNIVVTKASPGTYALTYVPGQDMCGKDTIFATLYDSLSGRSTIYDIPVTVNPPVGKCTMVSNPEITLSDFTIIPNPVASFNQAKIILPVNPKGAKLCVFDLTGKRIYEIYIPGGTTEFFLDVNQFNPGIYLVAIDNIVRKLVVQ